MQFKDFAELQKIVNLLQNVAAPLPSCKWDENILGKHFMIIATFRDGVKKVNKITFSLYKQSTYKAFLTVTKSNLLT